MDLSSLPAALAALPEHGYLVLFLIMFLEGPIITYVAAFAASLGMFDVTLVYLLSVLGNTLGDIPYYLIGRLSSKAHVVAFLQRVGVRSERLQQLEEAYRNNAGKALLVVKLSPVLPIPGLTFAGLSRMPFRKFMLYAILITLPSSLFFVLMGYYSGITYTQLVNYYKVGEIVVPIVLLLAGLAYFFWGSLVRKVRERFV